MGRRTQEGETLEQYKQRMIDPISESYCAAKWYNATIWLGHGQTASCHHPPGHWIPLDCLLYTSPSPRDNRTSRMPSSA